MSELQKQLTERKERLARFKAAAQRRPSLALVGPEKAAIPSASAVPVHIETEEDRIKKWVLQQIESAVLQTMPDEQTGLPPAALVISRVQRAACNYFEITKAELLAERRDARTVYARQIAMYLSKRATQSSLTRIGGRFGGKDHTTVLHGVNKIRQRVRLDWRVAYDVAQVERLFEQVA